MDNPRDASPRHVLLFSGHMIDAPDRPAPRFPAVREPEARGAIAVLLAQLDAGPQDMALCSGACGGDLLFAEAVFARGVPLEMVLPFDPAAFAVKSVDFAGADWHSRFEAAYKASHLHVMPQDTDAATPGANPYEQTNLWMLEAACRFGADRVHFICLWNGQGGDGPGGTAHLMQQVRQRQGRVHWLDTTQLWK